MMEQVLAEINALDDVLGSFICDNHGNVIVNAVPVDLNIAALRGISRQVTQAIAARIQHRIQEIDLTFTGFRVLIRDLHQCVLVVLCESDIDIALLRMTLNVNFAKADIEAKLSEIVPQEDVIRIVNEDDVDDISWRLYRSINEGVI
jgi:predicted regulator of Ras-like GTPase activity (Roadblock/LC7/MglB family)